MLLNYSTIIQNLYSSPAAIKVSEGLNLKQLLILNSSRSLLSLCHSLLLRSVSSQTQFGAARFASIERW